MLSTKFVNDRDWNNHDTTTNLCLAIVSEIGELAGIVAWTGDTMEAHQLCELRDELSQELADVTILLTRLCELYNFPLYDAFSKR